MSYQELLEAVWEENESYHIDPEIEWYETRAELKGYGIYA